MLKSSEFNDYESGLMNTPDTHSIVYFVHETKR